MLLNQVFCAYALSRSDLKDQEKVKKKKKYGSELHNPIRALRREVFRSPTEISSKSKTYC